MALGRLGATMAGRCGARSGCRQEGAAVLTEGARARDTGRGSGTRQLSTEYRRQSSEGYPTKLD